MLYTSHREAARICANRAPICVCHARIYVYRAHICTYLHVSRAYYFLMFSQQPGRRSRR